MSPQSRVQSFFHNYKGFDKQARKKNDKRWIDKEGEKMHPPVSSWPQCGEGVFTQGEEAETVGKTSEFDAPGKKTATIFYFILSLAIKNNHGQLYI